MATPSTDGQRLRWADVVDKELPPHPTATKATKKAGGGWTTVATSRRAKPMAGPAPIMCEVDPVDWNDEFVKEERAIFAALRDTFPKGLTAAQIAYALKKQGLLLSSQDVGNYLYGDNDQVSTELAKYVTGNNQKPRVWRIREK